jgi:hypothetical protein
MPYERPCEVEGAPLRGRTGDGDALGLSGRSRQFARRAASRRQESSGPSIGPHVLRGVLGRFTDRGRSGLFTANVWGFTLRG